MRFLLILLWLPCAVFAQSGLDQARQLVAQARYGQAQPLLEAEVNRYPADDTSRELLGDVYSHLQQWEAAVSCYTKLKTKHPQNADYQYKYGGALAMQAQNSSKWRALGMLDDVEQAFGQAIANNPKHLEARWALVEFYLQVPGIFGGSTAKARKYANELAVYSTVDGYLAQGRIAEHMQQYQQAAVWYRKAVSVGKSKTTYEKLANLYQYKLKDVAKARQVWGEYLKTQS